MRPSVRKFLLWAVLVLLFFSFYSIFSRQRANDPREVAASDFYDAVENGDVLDVEVNGSRVFFHLKKEHELVRTTAPVDGWFIEHLRSRKVRVEFERDERGSLWGQFLTNWTPLLALFAFYLALKRQLHSALSKVCEKGHVMHVSWAKCPNCQGT